MNGDVTVSDVMTREFVGASESDGVLDTVALMLEERVDCAVVLRGADPVGLLGERDVLRLLVDGGDPAATAVADVMSPDPGRIDPEASVEAAAERLSTLDARRLIVWSDGVAGLLTERDLVAAATIEPAPEPMPDVASAAGGGTYSSQSICETCGSLTRDLVDIHGQLLCPDCRDV